MENPPKKITAKRQKHLERQAKKMENIYSKEERQLEINKCIKQLNELSLFKNYSEDTEKVHQIMEDYVNTGVPVSGRINIDGTKRIFCYQLPKYKTNQISTGLKYDPNI